MTQGSTLYIGYFPAWPEEVGKGFVASAPVDWSNLGVLTNMDSDVEWKDIEELFKNNKVGIVGTYGYPDNIQQLMKKYPKNVDTSPDETALGKQNPGSSY